MPTTLDSLQIEIKSSATDASAAIKSLITSLQNLNRQLGLKEGTKLVTLLDKISGSATNVAGTINSISGRGFENAAKGMETATKAASELQKQAENAQKALEGAAYSKKAILGADANAGNPKITETGFTSNIRELSAMDRLIQDVNSHLQDFHTPELDSYFGRGEQAAQRMLPAVVETQKYALMIPRSFDDIGKYASIAQSKTEELRKDFSMFHMPDLGTGLPEKPLQQVEESAKKAASALEQAYEDMRKFKELISGMENGKLPFNQEDLTRYIQGYNNAKKVVDDFKKSLSGKTPTVMGDLLPQLLVLGEGVEKLAHKFDEAGNKGIRLLKTFTTPLKIAAEEYAEKFEGMKKSVDNFTKHVQARMTKLSAFWKRTMKTFTFMLVRKAITAIIKEVGNEVQSLAMYSNAMGTAFNTDISNMIADLQYLGRSIVSVFAPLFNYIAPIIDAITDRIATLLSYIGMLFAALGGGTSFTKAKKNVSNYAESLDQASKSAKNLTMGIDELNILSENKSGGSAKPYDGWEDAWEEVKIPDWIKDLADKIKKMFKDLFDPIKRAWDMAKDYVLSGWKYMTEQLKKLLADVWRDFLRVWKSDTVVHIFYNLFMILGDIERVIGNIAKRLDEAWNEGEKGYLIFKNIAEIIDILVQHVRNVTEYMVGWSDGLDFNALLQSIVNLTESLKDLADFIGGVFEDVMKNVVLKYIEFLIEDGFPHLINTISEVIDAFDFEKIRQDLVPLEEAFERLLENLDIGKTNALGNLGKMFAEFTNSQEFTDFMQRLADIMNLISAEDVEKVLTGIGKGILDIAEGIVKFVNSEAFMAFLKMLDEWLNKHSSDDIAGIFKAIADAVILFKFTAFVGAGVAGFIKFFTYLTTVKNIADIASKLAGTANSISILGKSLKIFGGVALVITGAITAIKTFFDMWTEGVTAFKGAVEIISGALVGLGLVVLGVASWPAIIVGALVGLGATIVALIHEHWDQIAAFFTETIPAWWNDTALPWLQSLPSMISEFFSNLWQTITSWASDKVSAIGVWLDNVKTLVSEKVSTLINSIVEFFASLPGKIGYALGFILGTITGAFALVGEWAVTNIPIIIDNIVTFFTELPGKIWEWLVGVVEKFVEWGAEVIAWITENVPKFIDDIVTWFTELPGKIYDAIISVIEKFAEWNRVVVEWIVVNIPPIIESFVKFFKDIPKKLYDLGTDIINGLINGVKDAWEGLKGGVADFCSSFVQGFKDALGIHSPSKEAEDLGDYWLEGLMLPFEHSNVDTQIVSFTQRFISLFQIHLSADKFESIGNNVITGLFNSMTVGLANMNAYVTQAFAMLTQLIVTNINILGANLQSNILPTFMQTYIFPFFNVDMWQPLFDNLFNMVFMPMFEQFRTWFSESMTAWWEEDLLIWFDEGKWDEDIFTPLRESFQEHWDTFSSWWDTTMNEWWENQVKPWFEKDRWKEQLTHILDVTKEVFDLIKEAIKLRIDEAGEAVAEACETMMQAIEDVMNAVDDMMDKLGSFEGFEGKITFDFGADKFATGGFPSKGSLFWASETGAGAEMVGTVGGKTGVVSNGEITGIRDAIYSTGGTESQLLAQLIQIGQAMLNKDPIVLSDKDIARMNNSGQNKLGMSIIS